MRLVFLLPSVGFPKTTNKQCQARNEAHLNHLNDVFEHFEIKCLEAVLMQEQVTKVTRSTQTERLQHRELSAHAGDVELAPIPVVLPEPGRHIPACLREFMATFPVSKRIMSQQALDKLLIKTFFHKVRAKRVCARACWLFRDVLFLALFFSSVFFF
jgi:hypothetical protein